MLAIAGGTLLAALVAYALHREYVLEIQAAGSETRNLARVLEEHARQSLRRVELSTARAADEAMRAGDLSRTDSAALRQRLVTHLPQDGLIDSFAIFGRDGAIALSTRADDPRGLPPVADRDYFLAHRDRAGLGMVIGAAIRSRVDGKWIMPVSRRLEAPGGGFQGVLLAVVNPAYFQSFYDSIDTGPNGFVTLFLRTGWIVVRSPLNEEILGANWADSPMFRVHLPTSDAQTVRQVATSDRVERVYSYRALKEYPVIVSLGVSLTDVLALWRTRAWRDGIILLIVLAVLAGAALALTRQLLRRDVAETALRESEARFRSLTDLSSDWYWEQDRELRLSFHSSGFAEKSGTTSDKLFGKRRWEEAGRIPLNCTWDEHRATLEAQQPFREFEYLRIGDGGKRHYISLSGTPIFDATGNFNGYRGVGKNITERKRIEETLKHESQRLKIAQRAARMIVVDWNIAVDRLEFSDSPEWLRGPLPGDGGKYPPFSDQVHPEDRALFLEVRSRALETLQGQTYEFRFVRTDGEVLWLRAHQVIFADLHGKAARMISALYDVTRRKHAEEKLAALAAGLEAKVVSRTGELAKALEAATAANRAKSNFMANVTHELRTPLNSVIGFAGLLKDGVPGPLNAKQAAFAADILAGGQRLLALVEGILEMSRLDGAEAVLRREPLDIGAALEERVAAHRKAAGPGGLAMRLDVAADTGTAKLDPGALRRMLDVLFDNAIKFNRKGGAVTASARRAGSALEIAVTDTGIGIAQQDLAKLFKPFAQLDAGLARRHGGVGLGLALARRLAELHGGTIEVESEPGKGSIFTLRLPQGERA